jgi:hypothetical protein
VEFKNEARLAGNWESVREADLFLLKNKFDRHGFDFLFFGSPFPAYRQRIARELNQSPMSDFYMYGHGAIVIDVVTGELGGITLFKPGGGPHVLVNALVRDFYRPSSIGALFSELFPHDYFNVYSSPNRVHQLIHRARKVKCSGLSLGLEQVDGSYLIRPGEGLAYKVPLSLTKVSPAGALAAKLKHCFGRQSIFTAAAAREKLEISEASFKRFVKAAVIEGHLEKVRASTATRYRLIAA